MSDMAVEDDGLTPHVTPPAAPLKGQLARRNLTTAVLQRGASTFSAFVRIPLLLHTLGPARYGVWLGIFAAAGLSTVSDFGLQMAVTQQVAELRGRGQVDDIRQVVATAFWLCMAGFLAVSAGVVFWVSVAAPFRHQAAAAAVAPGSVRALLLVACLASFAVQPAKILVAAQYGFERMYALNVCDVATIVVSVFGLWVLSGAVGGSLVVLGLWVVLWDLTIAVLVAAVLAVRHRAYLSISWRYCRRSLIAPLLRQAGAFFFTTIANGLRWSLDGLVILSVLGPAAVPHYEPSIRLFLSALTIVPLVFGTLWPSFAESAARRDWDWVSRAFGVATLAVLGIAIVIFTLAQLLGTDFLLRWVGPAGFGSRSILLLLGTWFLVTAWVQIAAHLTISLGAASTVMRWGLIEGVTNLLLTIALAHAMGLVGVAVASVVAAIAFGAIPITRRLLVLSEGHIELPARELIRLAGVGVAGLVVATVARGRTSAPLSVGVLLAASAVVGLATAGAVWFLVLTPAQRQVLVSQLPARARRSQAAA